MNNNYKFRAWIPSSKTMIYDGLVIGETEYGQGSVGIDTTLQEGEALKGLIWMQFTGITDENGKEIYDRDIVEDANGKKYFVLYSKDRGAFILNRLDKPTSFKFFINIDTNERYGLLVKGNLYENPKLLDSKKGE